MAVRGTIKNWPDLNIPKLFAVNLMLLKDYMLADYCSQHFLYELKNKKTPNKPQIRNGIYK